MMYFSKKMMLCLVNAGFFILSPSYASTNSVTHHNTEKSDNNSIVTLQDLLIPNKNHNLTSSGGQLTITGAGTIHYLQAFFYSDAGCTTLLGAASAIDNVQGKTFTSGETISLSPSSVYRLANNVATIQGFSTSSIACMKLYVDGGNQSADGVNCQSFTDETCSGTSCTSSQTKSVTWTSGPPTECATRYAYIANRAINTVTQCTVGAAGALTSCATELTLPSDTNPYAVAASNFIQYTMADASLGSEKSRYCPIIPSTGAFDTGNCISLSSLSHVPMSIAFNNKYAYITGQDTNTVYYYSVSPVFTASSAVQLNNIGTTGSGLDTPGGIAINNGYAYITGDTSATTVTKCNVSNATGAFSNCGPTGSGSSGLNNSDGIAIYNGYAYVTSRSNFVAYCAVNSTSGALTNCTSTGSAFDIPIGIAINNGYAYIANHDGDSVTQCTVNSDGTLTGCSATLLSSLDGPFGIAIY